MKERGLICKDDDVRAILDGRKTVFRRPLGPRVGVYTKDDAPDEVDSLVRIGDDGSPEDGEVRCPFGAPGDRLWVKEIHKLRIVHHCALDSCDCDDVLVEYEAGGEPLVVDGDKVPGSWSLPVRYESVASERPARSMPRWASRILLEVVSVRIERLHAITEDDARREGMGGKGLTASDVIDRAAGLPRAASFRAAFENKWRSFNYTKSHAWSENPFVWRVEFRRAP